MPSDKRVNSWHAGCMSGLLSMQPTGWFQVAWSTDLEVGDVRPLHYFGTDLVMFRGLDDAVHVLDAHCQHLGADLSHGGCVVEGGSVEGADGVLVAPGMVGSRRSTICVVG